MHGCENSKASPQQKYSSPASSLSPNTQWKKITYFPEMTSGAA